MYFRLRTTQKDVTDTSQFIKIFGWFPKRNRFGNILNMIKIRAAAPERVILPVRKNTMYIQYQDLGFRGEISRVTKMPRMVDAAVNGKWKAVSSKTLIDARFYEQEMTEEYPRAFQGKNWPAEESENYSTATPLLFYPILYSADA